MNVSDLARLDLNLLVVFHTLMQERHVTRAAARLNLSQSAVSAALGRLRSHLDDPLFVRATGTMNPTRRALEIAPTVALALSSIAQSLLHDTHFDPRTSRRTFHIALSDDIEMVLMPWLLHRSGEQGWEVDLAFHQTSGRAAREALADPATDLVISSAAPDPALGVRSQVLFTGTYLCLHDPRQLTLSDPMSFEEYIRVPHLRVSYDAQRGFVDDLLEARGVSRRAPVSISHFSGIVTALRQTPAIATLPDHAARALAEAAGLRLAAPPLPVPGFAISMIWDSRHDADPGSAWLREELRTFSLTSPHGGPGSSD